MNEYEIKEQVNFIRDIKSEAIEFIRNDNIEEAVLCLLNISQRQGLISGLKR